MTIRIGTRGSNLALFQAQTVSKALRSVGVDVEVCIIQTKGDQIQDRPLQSMGTGIFTKALDDALIAGEVDVAVHSMKDVPTQLLPPLETWAVLERANHHDVLVGNDVDSNILATGSIRRKAQWLHRFPHHQIVGLRGNVETRLARVANNPWRGGVFAAAGLERLQLRDKVREVVDLDWMIAAPAQGAIVIIGREGKQEIKKLVASLNHAPSQLATSIERAFLFGLEGGCSAPIGAYAKVEGEKVEFTGCLHALDGSKEIRIERKDAHARSELGSLWAEELLNMGGRAIMDAIKSSEHGSD
ncbi:MAG: hydroxymethylbilane synthase [Crocinitomicaceae bacterium]|nr:hydroxymethylbilane synthase [Crocinitomicaceae bacterium]